MAISGAWHQGAQGARRRGGEADWAHVLAQAKKQATEATGNHGCQIPAVRVRWANWRQNEHQAGLGPPAKPFSLGSAVCIALWSSSALQDYNQPWVDGELWSKVHVCARVYSVLHTPTTLGAPKLEGSLPFAGERWRVKLHPGKKIPFYRCKETSFIPRFDPWNIYVWLHFLWKLLTFLIFYFSRGGAGESLSLVMFFPCCTSMDYAM